MKAKNLGRLELLAWLNEIIDADYPKVENCSDGVAYCQLVDYLRPDKPNVIPLTKLNYQAKNQSEFQRNLEIFQNAVKKLNLPFTVPKLDQLSNGKF
jgi:RP/EB family microtubule-associated protein